MQATWRFYAYELDGKTEIEEIPNVDGCGSALTTKGESMNMVSGGTKWADKKGQIARTVIYRNEWDAEAKRFKVSNVTAADFGDRIVLIKAWYCPSEIEWFYLVPACNRMNPEGVNVQK